MKIIIVDDESFAIEALEFVLETLPEVQILATFQSSQEALDFVAQTPPDLAFLDIEMPGSNGIELAKKMKALVPDLHTVFVTGYNNYAQEAFDVEATGYILKPFTPQKIEEILKKVSGTSLKTKEPDVFVRSFGRFDIFVKGQVLVFKNKKAKELLALCVDHCGGVVTMEEAIDKLWEDRLYDERTKKLYRKAVMIASHTFEEAGAPGVFNTRRGLCYIDREKIACDYYTLLEGQQPNGLPFEGEYLFEYDWAEERIPEIWKIQEKLEDED